MTAGPAARLLPETPQLTLDQHLDLTGHRPSPTPATAPAAAGPVTAA